jgi:hypothetical protein
MEANIVWISCATPNNLLVAAVGLGSGQRPAGERLGGPHLVQQNSGRLWRCVTMRGKGAGLPSAK